MQLISNIFPGRIAICQCGAIWAWNDNDVYGDSIYCQLCKQPIHVDYDKNYNGVIQNDDKSDSK